MKEQKLKRGILCLYAVILVQVGMGVYTLWATVNAYISVNKILSENPELNLPSFGYGAISGSIICSVLMIVLTYYVIKDLKQKKTWAWVGALVVLLFSAPSFALPASIIGLISLLDEEVRNDFIADLQKAI
ncbi:hypothetical protein [uncultured Bdellovibrio sp.]|uniref:hypothetical protein n=1 Tax=Bdellovibrio sp. HCB-162 TaxID=3394234 RepID=UPI0025E00A50|nr:hypothetical protein [uncultured Bdellovibrio sp.]